MNRELRFRAWNKGTKSMHKVAHISNLLTVGTYITVRKNEEDSIIKVEQDIDEEEYEIMQYTGLKDKNGKEIYEGDILNHKLQCDDMPCGSKYKIVKWIKNNNLSTGFNVSVKNTWKVVGNIYENPELLTSKRT